MKGVSIMELILEQGFTGLANDELMEIDGGFIIAIIAIGSATITITSGTVATIAAVGTAIGAVAAAAEKTYNYFKN
jgi:urease accessory protein UreE